VHSPPTTWRGWAGGPPGSLWPADDRRQFEQTAFSIIAAERVPAIFGDSEAATAP